MTTEAPGENHDSVPACRHGDRSKESIYLSVGLAMSCWEDCEDILTSLFADLCKGIEPIAFEAYVRSSRPIRDLMLKDALNRYGKHVTEAEKSELLLLLRDLSAFAAKRNQIAHGYVYSIARTDEGVLIMEGCFLFPPYHEGNWVEGKPEKFAYTSEDINQWRIAVSDRRSRVIEIQNALRMRRQASFERLSPEARQVVVLTQQIQAGSIPQENVLDVLRPAAAT